MDGSPGEDVRPLFDQLAAKLLNLSGAPSSTRADLAWATTSSVEAFRSYLKGIEHLNQWSLGDAETDLSRATQIDSTFALAYYKLALTRGWATGQGDSLGIEAIHRATQYADRLPERDRTMIKAYRAFIDGDYAASRATYQQMLSRDSTDADAWYGLGDVWFHDTTTSVQVGHRHHTMSYRAFKRAIGLDPNYYLAYEHVQQLLNTASQPDPPMVLLPNDSFAPRTIEATGCWTVPPSRRAFSVPEPPDQQRAQLGREPTGQSACPGRPDRCLRRAAELPRGTRGGAPYSSTPNGATRPDLPSCRRDS